MLFHEKQKPNDASIEQKVKLMVQGLQQVRQ